MLHAIRPFLNQLSQPLRRGLHRLRNRHKIVQAPLPLEPERRPERPERILCIAWFDPGGLLTLSDSARLLGRYSRFRWDLMNLYGHETGRGLRLPRGLRLSDYRAVVVHNTASYDSDNLAGFLPDLAAFQGVKVLLKQDEQFRTNRIIAALQEGGFDLFLTCVPPEELSKVYPPEKLPRLRYLHVLTGYVTDEMRGLTYPATELRPIDIGYRGSPQAYSYGWLPYEKRLIAEVFQRVCAERGLTADIKFGWEDRFFGRAWLDFLGRSKATLGSESGGSVFDFDGELERQIRQYLHKHRNAPFPEVWERFLKPHEGKIRYAQVAPRHFEAAACRTVQILYEGRYSGIFQPGRHYLSLKRDLSNLEEVLTDFRDPRKRHDTTERAYQEIVLNDAWHYRGFTDLVDQELDAFFLARGKP